MAVPFPAAAAALLWMSVLLVSVRSEEGRSREGVGQNLREGLDGERVMMGYSDSWVVELDGGHEEADKLAEQHGFVNLGQVGDLEGVYHFALKAPVEGREGEQPQEGQKGWNRYRSGTSIVQEMDDRTAELNSDERVLISTQQKAFRKEPRQSFVYPSDPLWSRQWALFDGYGSTRGYDLNVVSAWIQGYTGQGIVVTVVDDGLQSSHPDLAQNYDSSASYNYIESVTDPTPYSLYDSHGTSCAGEIGMARDNNYCGVGVAYNCRLGGIRINLSYLLDVIEAQALNYRNNYIDIYSNSWGPPDNGFLVQGPGYYSGRALKKGISKGRGGLGSIWVWASGNGGRNDDSCAADGYASSMYTIAVGSADTTGKQAYYDEDCSGKMAVTFSYSSQKYVQMVSTSTQNRCVTTFTGTSASAPLLAGVIALVLESNPNLTWRDVQYLIAYTSDPTPFQSESGWSTNGAGLMVSHQFGFGTIDAEAMVTRAQHWTNVPQQMSCTITPSTDDSTATSGVPVSIRFSVSSSDCSVYYLEHVVVQMTLSISVQYGGYYSYDDYFNDANVVSHSGARRGDISVEMYSPYGTRSILLPERSNDFVNDKGYYSWPFMSVHHWGENPVGDWTVNIQFSSDAGYVTVGDAAVVLYGTNEIPESVQRIPEECSTECVRGCADYGEKYCDACKMRRIVSDLRCVSSCPGESDNAYKTGYGNWSATDDDSCSMGGYCVDCGRRFLGLSVPIIVLIAVTGLVVLVSGIFVTFVLWSKFFKSRRHYVSI